MTFVFNLLIGFADLNMQQQIQEEFNFRMNKNKTMLDLLDAFCKYVLDTIISIYQGVALYFNCSYFPIRNLVFLSDFH